MGQVGKFCFPNCYVVAGGSSATFTSNTVIRLGGVPIARVRRIWEKWDYSYYTTVTAGGSLFVLPSRSRIQEFVTQSILYWYQQLLHAWR